MPLRNDAELVAGDLGIGAIALQHLDVLQHFHQPRPVVGHERLAGFAAEGFEHFFKGLLRSGCRHAVGDIQPCERSCAVDAGIEAFDEAFPAALPQIRELQIGPLLDMFRDILCVIFRFIFADLPPGEINDADLAVDRS